MATHIAKGTKGLIGRGRIFVGTVIETKMAKTATVEWDRRKSLPKYERYEKRRTTVKAHIPDEMKVHKGDIVSIMECRPISKTKKFIVTEVKGKERLFAEREMRREESKVKGKEAETDEVAA